ncbi:hypothetical protein L6164_011004 [Bauhinia variegata]|uniref:Uncharacterized protein n=1 Tax=Bauhinia variegata TaxID=167791 RepID=A0ACB9P9Q9_BAUVA|nr:hypothetical protein L6164_011004 [Bauhinia variegata]
MRILSFTSVPGNLSDEDKWRAQYGQVTESGKEMVTGFRMVDFCGIGKWLEDVQQMENMRSAPICEAHLDLGK